MEVFIRDEETKWDISYSLADSNNSLDCKDHKPIIVKSLEQHDAELKAKWCDELLEYINKEYDEDECLIFRYDLKQKLEEMKGEKDE